MQPKEDILTLKVGTHSQLKMENYGISNIRKNHIFPDFCSVVTVVIVVIVVIVG